MKDATRGAVGWTATSQPQGRWFDPQLELLSVQG